MVKTELTWWERQILEVLYRLGESSATDIMKELPDELANATVRTQLRILEEKGIVKHRVDGKRFLYIPRCHANRLPKQRCVKWWMFFSAVR